MSYIYIQLFIFTHSFEPSHRTQASRGHVLDQKNDLTVFEQGWSKEITGLLQDKMQNHVTNWQIKNL
jgi:hypothetical protein